MVKSKKNRRSSAAAKHNLKTRVEATAKKNPFDLHVNRLKHDVLGKRRNYERGGQPLKSRERGIEKRKRTLLKELNSVFKKNSFIDHRLGENDPTLTEDEKLMQRLIAERSKMRMGKESRYNLNDEEDLTHYGQSLSKSDELNQKPVVDDFDDEDPGRLKSDHFFGGFQSSEGKKSKKEWIEDMIKSTKLDKYERQRENEKVFDMTQNLDEQWKALSTLMGIKERKDKEAKTTSDDYDKLVNSLRFETKTSGLPVKSIEERQKEEEERLKQLQIEETKRMEKPTLKSILSKSKKQTHRSVEELDESYYVMDGSNKRVTFDDDEQQNDLPLIEETVPSVDQDEEEQSEDDEETNNENLIEEFNEIPSNLDQLKNRIVENKSTLNVIWKRINDKRLPAIPRSVLAIYFDVLLDYFDDSINENASILNQIGKHLLGLLQLVNNETTKSNVIERLKQIQNEIKEKIDADKYFPADRSTIFFLKLIGHLYPTSDFRHPITTGALTLLVELVHHAALTSLNSIRQALFLLELVRQWIVKTHRYVPEVLLLFRKIFQLICSSKTNEHFVLCSSKQVTNGSLLALTNDVQLSSTAVLDFFKLNDFNGDNEEDRALIIELTLNSLVEFLGMYRSLSAINEISRPFEKLLHSIAENCPSQKISSHCREIIDFIQTNCRIERNHLQQGKEETKILRLFQPRFGPVYEGKKSTRLSKEFTERLRLRKKYKRDLKSTVRALVVDNQVIAREELRQQMEKDAQRKRKVKEIQAELSMQEGEYRKMKKIL